jgi:hypothetical protein
VVDVNFGAAFFDQVFLAWRVDADDAHAHAAGGDLDGEVAKLEVVVSVPGAEVIRDDGTHSASCSQ